MQKVGQRNLLRPTFSALQHGFKAAEMLELTDILQHPLTNLSGGELQRVSIARVLVKNAEIYLLPVRSAQSL